MAVLLFEYKVKRGYKLKHFYLDSHIPLFCLFLFVALAVLTWATYKKIEHNQCNVIV